MAYSLEIKGLCKHFGGVTAANDVYMTVEQGQIRGLIGPNGAGKTTILNLISGIYQADAGQVFLNGIDITKWPAYRRARFGLGRTFQAPRFLRRSNIRDNMLLGTDLADQMGYLKSFLGVKGSDFDKELQNLMEIAGFTVDQNASITGLPYGQQKLLEIIRTMLSHPKAMLVDEPAAGLNETEQQRASDLLRFAAGQGIGVILIEHSMDMVMSVCDRITVINFGQVICEGTPATVANDQNVIEAYLGGQKNAVD